MRKLVALAALGLLAAPAVARAQMHNAMDAKHEFGVDVGIGYTHFGSVGGVSCATNCGQFAITTPVNLRVGFVSSGNMMWEARSTLSFTSGGGTFINFDPGVNVLFNWGHPTARNDNKYFTVGADLGFVSNSPSGGTSTSGVMPGINGAIGMRSPYGSGAIRLEAGVRYQFSNTTLGSFSQFQVGALVGLSLWH